MAEILYLEDGDSFIIHTSRDFSDMLREKLGDEAEYLFTGYIEDYEYQIAELETERDNFELNADGYLRMCLSTAEELEGIIRLCMEAGTKKREISKALQNALKDLRNNL